MSRVIYGVTGAVVEEQIALRDYFIAHAPAEPQPWFKVEMEPCSLKHPCLPPDLTQEERNFREGVFEGFYREADAPTERLREYYAAEKEYETAFRAWSAENQKQYYIQWPAAWADEMLKVREAK